MFRFRVSMKSAERPEEHGASGKLSGKLLRSGRCAPVENKKTAELNRRFFLSVQGVFGRTPLTRNLGSPNRIRTGVTAVRGRRPRPLDDRAALPEMDSNHRHADSESAVLPAELSGIDSDT